ncbi:hypothetical protein P5673_005321 [Acropora cervicornis]|uniref:Uncharacterized protein n=1 Tax=Acropora cervicornis TaxID=6130 RepID=A0AAD9QXU3_ACRCE|nr:hypothetical protein P5673_005321 [Acropora cervicornis]
MISFFKCKIAISLLNLKGRNTHYLLIDVVKETAFPSLSNTDNHMRSEKTMLEHKVELLASEEPYEKSLFVMNLIWILYLRFCACALSRSDRKTPIGRSLNSVSYQHENMSTSFCSKRVYTVTESGKSLSPFGV